MGGLGGGGASERAIVAGFDLVSSCFDCVWFGSVRSGGLVGFRVD